MTKKQQSLHIYEESANLWHFSLKTDLYDMIFFWSTNLMNWLIVAALNVTA